MIEIIVKGIKGSGKTTVAALLNNLLASAGYHVTIEDDALDIPGMKQALLGFDLQYVKDLNIKGCGCTINHRAVVIKTQENN